PSDERAPGNPKKPLAPLPWLPLESRLTRVIGYCARAVAPHARSVHANARMRTTDGRRATNMDSPSSRPTCGGAHFGETPDVRHPGWGSAKWTGRMLGRLRARRTAGRRA